MGTQAIFQAVMAFDENRVKTLTREEIDAGTSIDAF